MRKEITLWPLVPNNGEWSVPDYLLLDIWSTLLDKGLNKILFYDGTVTTGLEWLNYIKSPIQFTVFGVSEKDKEFLGMGWLSNIQHSTAEAHFCFFNSYIPGGGEKIIEYWGKLLSLKVLYGYTPESYETVLKLLRKWGFKDIGIIPNFCEMKYKNTREGAVVSYRQMEELNAEA